MEQADIRRTAHFIMSRYGAMAAQECDDRIAYYRAQKNTEGRLLWQSVKGAIMTLRTQDGPL
jgi:hypothetical protein